MADYEDVSVQALGGRGEVFDNCYTLFTLLLPLHLNLGLDCCPAYRSKVTRMTKGPAAATGMCRRQEVTSR